MIKGSYRNTGSVNFDEFWAPNAYEYLVKNCDRYLHGQFDTCGTAAISTLTGIRPKIVDSKRPKSNDTWSDRSFIKFLRTRHFTVKTLSQCDVTNISPERECWTQEPIRQEHVLLLGPLVCRNEATWGIVTQRKWFHNFEVTDLDPMFLINKPIQNAYIIKHPKWA